MSLSLPAIQGIRQDPIILLGMHHSGTSIFTEVLDSHGVFMHANWNHHESKLFTRDINNRMIMGDGKGWIRNPIMPVAEVMTHLQTVHAALQERLVKKFQRDGYDGVSPWGWKDPRTCVTLPLFLEIFPEARLVHIVRDEADVAESLASRKKKGIGLIEDRQFWRQLHRQHVERAREYGTRHGRYHEFRYEDWCYQPVEVTRDVFDFLELEFPPELERFLLERVYRHRIGISSENSELGSTG